MNTQPTLSINGDFLAFLINCKEQKINAAMFLDAKGMIRIEGLIRSICLDVSKPFLELESGTKVNIKTIRTVNGILSSSFSEHHSSQNGYPV